MKRFDAGKKPWALYPPLLRDALFWRRRNPWVALVIGLLSGALAITVVSILITLKLYDISLGETARAAQGEADAKAQTLRAEAGEAEAKAQKLRAEGEKLRAEENEAKTLEKGRENLRQAASFALSRGQRLEALAFYDRLLPMLPAEEQLACRVECLPCLFAYSQWLRLMPELAQLTKLPLPPKLHSQVLLHQGDVELWRVDLFPGNEGQKHLKAALAIADGLKPADAEYARGLLADGCLAAIEHYKKALALDPFHPRARVNLLFELIFSGQFELAERQLEIAAASFPQEPLVPSAGVFLTTLQQRLKDREPFVERLRQQMPKEHFDKFKKVFLAMDRGIQAFAPEQNGGTLGAAEARFVNPFLPDWGVRDIGPLVGVASPAVRRPAALFGGLLEVFLRVTIGNNQGACTVCEAWSQKSPESWIRVAQGMARAQLALKHQKEGKWREMSKEYTRSFELLAEARRLPTILPNSGVHRQATWTCLVFHAGWLEERQRISRSTATALLQPPGPPGSSLFLSDFQLNAGLTMLKQIPEHFDRSWVLAAVKESHKLDAARSQLLPEIVFFLPIDDARFLLSDWELNEPSSAMALQLRAKLEFAHRNWSDARRYTEKALARQAQNKEMRKLLEQLLKLDQFHP